MNGTDRKEEYTLEGGEGLFEIRGGGFDRALLFGGIPVALLWCDCAGSVGQFLVRSRRSLDVSAEVRHLRHVTDGGLDPGQPLAPQIAPLLALFAGGPYVLTYESAVDDCDLIGFDDASSLLNQRDYFYPAESTLVATRPYSSLDPSRVEYYRGRISSGVRPVALTVRVGYAAFVLDGHHKLAAYRALGSPPAVLSIERVEPPQLTPEAAGHAFAEAPSFYEGYLRLKREYGG